MSTEFRDATLSGETQILAENAVADRAWAYVVHLLEERSLSMLVLMEQFPYCLAVLLDGSDENAEGREECMKRFRLHWEAYAKAKTSGVPHVLSFLQSSPFETRLMQDLARCARWEEWSAAPDSALRARLVLLFSTFGHDHMCEGARTSWETQPPDGRNTTV